MVGNWSYCSSDKEGAESNCKKWIYGTPQHVRVTSSLHSIHNSELYAILFRIFWGFMPDRDVMSGWLMKVAVRYSVLE